MNNFTQLIRYGKHTDHQKDRVINHISKLVIDENLEYEVIVKRYVESKTTAQLNYYWGVVVVHLMMYSGCDKKEADAALKEELVTPKFTDVLGKTIETKASIAEMNIKVMSEYIDNCINFLGTWGVNVPSPPYKSNHG